MAQILVIDDDTSLLQMMSIMLKRAGHTPIIASDGNEGIQIARNEQPDMVIVDAMMPEISGYEVCLAIRKEPTTQKIPLLMLTALSQPEHRGKAEDAGADAFITKPVTRDDLVKHVDELLRIGARNFPDFVNQMQAAPASPPVAVSEPTPVPTPTPAPAAAPAMAPKPPTGPLGALPLVVVMGLGSGTGATTIAVNLSLALMEYGRACLVDLNHRGGQAALHLRVAARGTWLNLVSFTSGSDKRMIAQALTVEHPSGVALIAAPQTPVADRLSGATIHYLFGALSEGFSRVVVDSPMEMDATSIATLNEANHIVLTLGNDPADLVAVPSMLQTLEALRLPAQVHIVLNHTRPHGISYETAMQTVNAPLAVDIPYEPAQIDSLSTGRPILMSQPASLFSRTILHLARFL